MVDGTPRMINQEGLDLIKSFEKLYLASYLDPVGIWTVGYGHTKTAEPDMVITEGEAVELLHQDLLEFEEAVEDAVQISINDNQFAALVSFTFNLGIGSLWDSTLLKLLNVGDIRGAANEFLKWDKAGGQALLGLTRRRRAERALFLSQPWRNLLDYEEVSVRVLKLSQTRLEGEDVRRLQTALKKLGFNVYPDGVFGKNTDYAVRKFQESKGLIADGIVGGATREALGL